MNVANIVGHATAEETRELALAALEALPQDDAVMLIRDWIRDHKLEGEFDIVDDDE